MSKLNLFIDSPLITVFIQNMFRFENPYSLGLFSSLMLPQYAECNFLNYCGHSPLESNNISSTGKASVLPAPMPAAQLAISNFLEKTLHLQQLKAMALSENGLMKKPCSPPDAGGAAAGATTAGSGGGKRRARCGTKKHGTSIVSTDAAEAVAEAGVKSNSFTIDAILQKPKAVNSSSHKTRRVQCSDHVTNGDCDGLMSPFLDGVVCFPPTMGKCCVPSLTSFVTLAYLIYNYLSISLCGKSNPNLYSAYLGSFELFQFEWVLLKLLYFSLYELVQRPCLL